MDDTKMIEYNDEFDLNFFTDPALGHSQIQMPRGPCTDCGKENREHAYTSSHLWFEVAEWDTILCMDCWTKRHVNLKQFEESNGDDDTNDWL